MKRYDYQVWENDDGALEGWLSEGKNGDYVEYEEAHLIEVDRDIKAANLQLLVEKVLEASVLLDLLHDDEDNAVTGIFSYSTKEAIAESKLVVDLARSLKQ